MITIPDPPALHPCAGCLATPQWWWNGAKWVPLVPERRGWLRVHDCAPRRRSTPPDLAGVRSKLKAASAKYHTEESLHG